MHKLIDHKGRVLFVQRESEVVAILAGRTKLPKPTAQPSFVTRLGNWLPVPFRIPFLFVAFVLLGEHAEPAGDVYPPQEPPPPFEPRPLPPPWIPV